MKNLLFLFSLFISGVANATDYYFSTITGDDNRTSLQAQNASTPWKSISKLNSFFSSLNAGDKIYFKRGEIFYGGITVNKSGTSASPITISAYGTGADPVITGFYTVPSWTNTGTNIWESTAAVSTLSSSNIISINGVNVAMGRMPKTGFWTIGSTNGSNITDATNLNSTSKNWTGAQVVMRKYRWIMDKFTITAASGSSISFTNSGDAIQAGWGYFIQNDVKALTQQNDWSYNSATKKISIYSTSTPVNVQVPAVEVGANLNNNNYITFDNISFSGFNSTGINTTSKTGIIIQNGAFNFIGSDAIYGYPNSPNLKVTGNTFNEINSRGIHAGSSSNAYINNNTLLNTGNLPGMGGNGDDSYTAIISNGDNAEVSYNSITNAGYVGIRWDGNATVIKNNFVNTTNYIKDDGGGIYCYPNQLGPVAQSYTQRTVSNNIVINSIGAIAGGTPSSNNSEGMGIYNDGTSPNVNYTNNTIANAQLGLFLNGAHETTSSGNTIYNCARGYYLLNYNSSIGIANNTVSNNIFVARDASQYTAYYEPGGTAMPSSFSANNNIYARPIDDNATIWRDGNGTNYYNTLTQWKTYSGQDAASAKSPLTISNANDLRLVYNETAVSKTVSLGANYIDLKNISFAGSITLAPYTSAILIKSGAGNVSPSANAGVDKVITLPTATVSLTGSGTDPDGTIASYLWTKISGPAGGTITSTTVASTTITALIQGIYKFELRVTDNAAAIARDTMQVTVNAAGNVAPAANAGSDKTITLPTATVSLTGTGTDPDGTIASYLWTKISGPVSGTITSATSAATSVNSLVQGVYKFELRVTDNAAAIARDTMQVTVNAAGNVVPAANAGSDQTIILPLSAVNLAGTGTDSDGTIASYNWLKISGAASAIITTSTSAATTVTGLTEGIYIFELTVTDNKGATAKDNVQVSVSASFTVGEKIINVNIYGGTNPVADTKWNNWKTVAKTVSSNFKYEDGTQSKVNAVLSAQEKISNNGTGYATAATSCPPAVLRYYSVNTAQRTLTIKGLNATGQYTFRFYASSSVVSNGTSFLIGSVSDDIMTDNNVNAVARIQNVKPDANGTVVVKLLSIYTYNYIAGFTIIEQSGPVAGRSVQSVVEEKAVITEIKPVTEEPKVSVSIFPNPFTSLVKIQLNSGPAGVYQLSLIDISGRPIWKKALNKSGGAITEPVNTSNLPGGVYILQVISPDKVQSSFKIMKLN